MAVLSALQSPVPFQIGFASILWQGLCAETVFLADNSRSQLFRILEEEHREVLSLSEKGIRLFLASRKELCCCS